MEIIGGHRLWSFTEREEAARPATCTEVRKGRAREVRSYMDLATKVAELQFLNRDHVLLFRGQNADYKNDKAETSIKPSLFRGNPDPPPHPGELLRRFERLKEAESQLVHRYQFRGSDRLERQQILRWSILQHYEVCPTPLLDVTHSLRIAASFASEGAEAEAFVFALGVPNLSGAITASAEAGIQITRLSSVCPPTALRPHLQEGYLLGEYLEMTGFDQKRHYPHHEIDVGRRLVAKFSFDPRSFWNDTQFPKVERPALYPDADDPLFHVADPIRQFLDRLL
jgi:hypothetical protein